MAIDDTTDYSSRPSSESNEFRPSAQACKEDALELAQMLYDIFKKQGSESIIKDGQNNAQQITDN